METFKKRSGTTNEGTVYEKLNIANIGLNCVVDDTIENFYISSNDENFGDFDDIVIKIPSVTGNNVSALQLKHNRRGTLALKQLKQEKGDFSIKKYFNSVQNINCTVDNFILYTNLKLDYKKHTRFSLDGENFQIEISHLEPKDIFFKISDKSSHCYKFHIVEDECAYDYSPEILMYKHFFDKFYLMVNQDNSKCLETKIAQKLKTLFLANQTECDAYLKIVEEWSQQEGQKRKLCKSWVQRAIAVTLLSSRIKPLSFGSNVNENMKILREAIVNFNVTLLEHNAYDKIKNLWGDAKSYITEMKHLNEIREMYHLSSFYIQTLDNLDPNLLSTLLWLNDQCPIIVMADAVVHKAIELCPKARFIVLVNDINEENISYEKIKPEQVFRNLSDLKTPHRDQVLEKFHVCVQGKEQASLQNAFSLDFIYTIRTGHLVEMLDGPYAIGGLLENLPKPYIERNVWRNIINVKYFQKINENTSVVIDCVRKIDLLKHKLNNCNIHDIEDYLNEREPSTHSSKIIEGSISKVSVFIITNKCNKTQFEAICDKNKDAKNHHHLRFIDEDSFEWIQSKGNVNSLEEYKMNNFLFSEKEMWCRKLANNINLIISNPGMGKSELMKSLKNTSPSKIWTIIMNPTDISLFSKYITNDNDNDNLDITLQNFIFHEKYKSMDKRAKEFFQVFVKQNQVSYVWDALDEIPTESLETITNLIVELSKKDHPQWITSRFQLKHLLETKFTVLSLNLSQFTEQEQSTYIKKRLENIDITEDIEEIISRVRSSFALVEHKEILGIPLQIFMLTNLLRKDITKYFTLLSDIFVLTDLYHYFVQENMKVYFEKMLVGYFKNSFSESVVKILEASILKHHQDLALKTLFSVDFLKKLNIDFESNIEEFKEEYVLVGLVINITCKPVHFIHNCFAEYFAALYFSQNQHLSSIFVDVIFEPKYVNVRFFFDLLLARESPVHVAVLYKNMNLLEKYGNSIRTSIDGGGRSALHVASSWGQRHPRLKVTKTADAYVVNDLGFPNAKAENMENLKILNYLLSICDLSQQDTFFKMTPLMYAQKSDCLVFEIKILKQQNKNLMDLSIEHLINILYYTAVFGYDDVIDNLNSEVSTYAGRPYADLLKLDKKILNARNLMGMTLLYLASSRQSEKVVKFLVKLGASTDCSAIYGFTPLHIASLEGHCNIVEFLVLAGAKINHAVMDGATPLFAVCQFGHIKVVERLLALGANINQPKNGGATPLHIACLVGHKNIVELLVASGAEINRRAANGFTPLAVACLCGHIKVIERLLALGANINEDAGGGTVLHTACENGRQDIVELLVASGAEINRGTMNGFTPLFKACNFGHIKIVELLLALGANINQPENTGTTPLHIACHKGHENIVELLVASGAEINHGKADGFTPLFLACLSGHTKVVERLLALGVNINQPSVGGGTVLHIACQKGHENMVEFLVASGAEINRVTTNGLTPLHVACGSGHIKIVQRLLVLGANINQTGNMGVTSLHITCIHGHENIVEILVASGAEINRKTTGGFTPLFLARARGHTNVVERLLALGGSM